MTKYEETFFVTRPMVASRGTLCVWAPNGSGQWHGMPTWICSWWSNPGGIPILVAVAHHSLQ
jgi:hypothetical protein